MSRENNGTPFTSMQDIARICGNRSVTLFGAGNIAEKTKRLLAAYDVVAIVDNSSNLWGQVQLDVPINGPSYLGTKDGKDSFYIITTTSFSDVSEQLKRNGFKEQVDFVVSPILNDLRVIDEMENLEKTLFFSSGSPKQDDPSFGGGIYRLTLSGSEWMHEKEISGNCYGMTRFQGTLSLWIPIDELSNLTLTRM